MSRNDAEATERTERVWDRLARHVDKQMGFWERRLFRGDREWACAQARGDVLEVAVGTGRSLDHHPADVRLTGIERSPVMLARARRRASQVRPDAELLQHDAQALTFDNASFDTVLCTYSLCSISDDAAAVREMGRVLRPGGTLVFVEHVASDRSVVRAVQWLIHQVTHRLALEHMLREPRELLAAAGREPVSSERRKAGIVDRIVVGKPPAPGRLLPDQQNVEGHSSVGDLRTTREDH